jgi:chromosomal replication initiator protein
MSLSVIWEKAQSNIKEKIGSVSYETWFAALKVKEKGPHTLIIETPDDFFKNWIIDHYQVFIQESINHLATDPIELEFSVNHEILKTDARPFLQHFEQESSSHKAPTNISSRFTFENFVVGPSNRFAAAASLAVAESPAKAYNPLFIYGHVGLGKTHIIQAITNKIRQLHSNIKISYLTSEQFTNELIDAIRHKSTPQFRKKYREIDVLLIDDIHFIAGKESTQEEFFHTFNFLHDNKKQIIITSDRPPREIANLEERLSSRFAWGLITDIQPPDFETRVAILRKKVEREPVRVPDEVINFIAEQIKTNIRELEGALIRVTAYALLEEKPIALDMARIILKDMVKETLKTITIEMIQKTVCEHYRMSLSELRSKRRTQNIVLARQIAMYLARQLANMSLPEIGHSFGGKDHTTVLHSCNKISQEVEKNETLKATVKYLSNLLKQ